MAAPSDGVWQSWCIIYYSWGAVKSILVCSDPSTAELHCMCGCRGPNCGTSHDIIEAFIILLGLMSSCQHCMSVSRYAAITVKCALSVCVCVLYRCILLKKPILHVSQLWFSPYQDVSYPLNFAQLSFNVLDCNCGVSHGNDILCWKTERAKTHWYGSDNGIIVFTDQKRCVWLPLSNKITKKLSTWKLQSTNLKRIWWALDPN